MLGFIRREAVLCAAVLAAAVSACLVPPSAAYIGYIDFRTLALLLCLMLTVAGAKAAGAFRLVTGPLLRRAGSARALALLLSAACFFSSMLITNDVALITLVPLALLTIPAEGGALITSVVLMTAAANLGSMLTPIGNPQNLYLYSAFGLSAGEFFGAMLPPTLISAALLGLGALLVKPLPVAAAEAGEPVRPGPLLPWAALFLVCVACVARLLDWRVMLAAVLIAVLLLDRRLLLRADYSLLPPLWPFSSLWAI